MYTVQIKLLELYRQRDDVYFGASLFIIILLEA